MKFFDINHSCTHQLYANTHIYSIKQTTTKVKLYGMNLGRKQNYGTFELNIQDKN